MSTMSVGMKCLRCGELIVRRLARAKFCCGMCRTEHNNEKRKYTHGKYQAKTVTKTKPEAA